MPDPGTLHCLGIGPGDPELVTVKAARLLGSVRHVVAPTARIKSDSLALAIARPHLGAHTQVHERIFPMTADRAELTARWDEAAADIDALLLTGEDVCFPTLGDPLLYSTALYLARALRRRRPGVSIQFVPGVTAFSAVASITQVPVGEAKRPVTIVPTADDEPEAIRRALATGGAVVLMKIGKRLGAILNLLAECGALERAVMVSRAGLPDQQVFTDLVALHRQGADTEYLAIILIPAPEGAE
jgi:precorrin-2/cobalt-factor-2 C20-methyltransferase